MNLEKLTMNDLQWELRRRQRRGVTLKRQRDRVAAKLAKIDGVLVAVSGKLNGVAVRHQNDGTLVEFAVKALKGKELSVTKLADRVQELGYKTTSPNFRTIVNQALLKHDDVFKNVSRGKYTLK